MSLRFLAGCAALLFANAVHAQEAIAPGLVSRAKSVQTAAIQSAWLDLRQLPPTNSTPQSAPAWIESVDLVPVVAQDGTPARTIFRIRVSHPPGNLPLLLFRLFFEDKPKQRPIIIAWDESGSRVLRSNPLGDGIDLPTSDTVMLPMMGVSCIDVDVPGDGQTVRGLYLDWMTSQSLAHPVNVAQREMIPEPFAGAAPLSAPAQDKENFGTVTATLSAETIRIGPSVAEGATFQFGIESRPLVALLSFEVASARVDSPPLLYVNGENLGPVSLVLNDLADPGYRGETRRMVDAMRFRYTGWLRAQKLVPASNLRAGTNDVMIIGGPGTPASAIRATQIQLKYLWEKSDYLLDPH